MKPINKRRNIKEAINILKSLGMPKAQQNERSALCLLALLNLSPEKGWNLSENPLIGITPIIDWIREHYHKNYAPNTRETIRKHSIHQFVEAGIALYNPDKPNRAVNSPRAVYQIETNVLNLLRSYKTQEWDNNLADYLKNRVTLIEQYAKKRKNIRIPIKISDNTKFTLSPGEHSELIRKIIEDFGPRFIPNGSLVYVGDTGEKWGFFDKELFNKLGIHVDSHGKMPDVVLYHRKHKWLLLIECVTSHGPIDEKRYLELSNLFMNPKVELIYITAFQNRTILNRYFNNIAWETEVWIADNPSHLIHFNGDKFLGPYNN